MKAFLPEENLALWMAKISESMEVLAPLSREGSTAFATWKGEDISFPPGNVIPSPVKILLPPEEVLFRYIQESGRYRFEVPEPTPRIILGLRPCDVRALEVLDAIFDREPQDLRYMERRRSTVTVAVNCTRPVSGCFCSRLGSGPGVSRGCDLVMTTISSGGYLVEALSPAGTLLLREHQQFFLPASQEMEKEKDMLLALAKNQMDKDWSWLNEQGIRKTLSSRDFEEMGQKCLSCGGCSFVCPTCHCFTIFDRGVPDGERIRSSDSCVLSGFSRLTSGANPRPTAADRLRHWYMDKFVYLPETTGLSGCVGCGRCARVCLAGFNGLEALR